MIHHMIQTPKCAVWAFMGAGKSAAVLTALDTMDLAGITTKPALIVAPLRVAKYVWPDEIAEWEHLQHMTVSAIVGTRHERECALATKADIYTTNYENFLWLSKQCENHWPFGTLVLDESSKTKSLRATVRRNPSGTEWIQGVGGKRSKEILKTIHRFTINRVIELSGTPAPNGIKDLWGQIFLLDYGQRLGRVFDAFKNRWFETSFDGWTLRPREGAQGQIHRALQDICLSLKSEDWFDVQTPIVRKVMVQLPVDARRRYKDMERRLFAEINGHEVQAFNAGAKTQKLLQFASGFAYIDGYEVHQTERQWTEVHKEKLDALEEIVEEWAGQPIMVAYQYRADLERLRSRFPQARVLGKDHSTIADWNKGQVPILLAHPASAGHGINLQHGSNVLVYFGCGWNFEEDAQIAERIGPVRQMQSGYNRNVYLYRIAAQDTIDEEVMDVLEQKCTVQDALMTAMRRRG